MSGMRNRTIADRYNPSDHGLSDSAKKKRDKAKQEETMHHHQQDPKRAHLSKPIDLIPTGKEETTQR